MRTLQDLQENLIQLKSCRVYCGDKQVAYLEQRLTNLETTIVVMLQIMVQDLVHEIDIRRELTGQ